MIDEILAEQLRVGHVVIFAWSYVCIRFGEVLCVVGRNAYREWKK